MLYFLLCILGLIGVLNEAIGGAFRTAAAKLFQRGIVCGIRDLLYNVE